MISEDAPQLNPELLVARILAELQANPAAQPLLLRAILTEEFLRIPGRLSRMESRMDRMDARMDRMESRLEAIEKDVAELKADVAELKSDMAEAKADISGLKANVAELKDDMAEAKADIAQLKDNMQRANNELAYLRGSDLENRLHRNLRSIISQQFDLMRPRIMQSQLQEPLNEFADQIYDAYSEGRITREQYRRIEQTDFIMRAQHPDSHDVVLVAVEASSTVDAHDVTRARESADALALALEIATIAVVAGHRIHPRDLSRAQDADVEYAPVSYPSRPPDDAPGQ